MDNIFEQIQDDTNKEREDAKRNLSHFIGVLFMAPIYINLMITVDLKEGQTRLTERYIRGYINNKNKGIKLLKIYKDGNTLTDEQFKEDIDFIIKNLDIL